MRIQARQEEHALADLWDALAVSRERPSRLGGAGAGAAGAQANAALWPRIQQAREESRQTYGSPRLRRWLERHGQKCSRHRVARLMRGHRMASQTKRRFRVQLTDGNHDLPVAPNRLRDLERPARRGAGRAMEDTPAASPPLAALDMALKPRRPTAGLGAPLGSRSPIAPAAPAGNAWPRPACSRA